VRILPLHVIDFFVLFPVHTLNVSFSIYLTGLYFLTILPLVSSLQCLPLPVHTLSIRFLVKSFNYYPFFFFFPPLKLSSRLASYLIVSFLFSLLQFPFPYISFFDSPLPKFPLTFYRDRLSKISPHRRKQYGSSFPQGFPVSYRFTRRMIGLLDAFPHYAFLTRTLNSNILPVAKVR